MPKPNKRTRNDSSTIQTEKSNKSRRVDTDSTKKSISLSDYPDIKEIMKSISNYKQKIDDIEPHRGVFFHIRRIENMDIRSLVRLYPSIIQYKEYFNAYTESIQNDGLLASEPKEYTDNPLAFYETAFKLLVYKMQGVVKANNYQSLDDMPNSNMLDVKCAADEIQRVDEMYGNNLIRFLAVIQLNNMLVNFTNDLQQMDYDILSRLKACVCILGYMQKKIQYKTDRKKLFDNLVKEHFIFIELCDRYISSNSNKQLATGATSTELNGQENLVNGQNKKGYTARSRAISSGLNPSAVSHDINGDGQNGYSFFTCNFGSETTSPADITAANLSEQIFTNTDVIRMQTIGEYMLSHGDDDISESAKQGNEAFARPNGLTM